MRNSVLGPVVEIDGKLWRRNLVDGSWLPFSISGGADDDGSDETDDDDEDDDDDSDAGDGAKGEKTLSQRSVKRIAAKNKREGRRAGERALLESIGVESAEDLKALVDDAKKRKDAETSESEKNKNEAAAEREARKRVEQELSAIRRERAVERELLKADIPPKMISKVSRLLDLDDLDEDADAEDVKDAVKKAVSDLKKDVPALFSDSGASGDEDDGELDPLTGLPRSRGDRGDGGSSKPSDSKPPQPPRGKNSSMSSEEQARSILHRRHPNLADSKS